MSTDDTVITDPDHRRHDVPAVGTGGTGFVDHRGASELVVLAHTEVDPPPEGRGVGRFDAPPSAVGDEEPT